MTMSQRVTFSGLSIVACVVVLLGIALTLAFLWGPLHPTYERACALYPALRSIGPVPFALFMAAFLASTTLGVGSLVAGMIRSVRLSNRIQRNQVEASAGLRAVTSDLSLQGRVICIEDRYPHAFCYSLFRPMVCISTTLVDSLESDELRAVLAHEREHLIARDPLRLLCGKALARALFLMPQAEDLYRRLVLQRELRADDSFIALGQRDSLASALFKLLTSGAVAPTGVAAFNLTEERIRYISEPDQAVSLAIPWKRAFAHTLIRVGLVVTGLGILGGTIEASVVGCLL